MRVLAYLYPIILGLMLACTVGLFVYMRKRVRVSALLLYVIGASVAGLTMNVYVQQFDPEHPAWMYHEFMLIGPEWLGVHLYDWLFYPFTAAMFFLIRSVIPNGPDVGIARKTVIMLAMLCATLAAVTFLGNGGGIFALWFALPGIVLLAITMSWNATRLGVLFAIMVSFGLVWDWMSVDWLASLPGMSWCQHWMYRWQDAQGAWHHSTLWRPESWAWIGNRPLAEWPWFAVSGSIFALGWAEMCDIVFPKRNRWGGIAR